MNDLTEKQSALAVVWEAWDRQCLLRSDRDRRDLPTVAMAGHVADCCAAVAADHGLTSVELRARMTAARRAGSTITAAVEAVCAGGPV